MKKVDIQSSQTICDNGDILYKGVLQEPELRKGKIQIRYRNGRNSNFRPVKRIIAEHLMERPKGKNVLINVNGDPTDNSVTNLKWVDDRDQNTFSSVMRRAAERFHGLNETVKKLKAELESANNSLENVADIMDELERLKAENEKLIKGMSQQQKDEISLLDRIEKGLDGSMTFHLVKKVDMEKLIKEMSEETKTKWNKINEKRGI